ncbi:hypothetical protein EDD85DRAFT_272822 [Armillaria nabsnona]|nr:hypothetical protein EDD85DRAFT_272822 [Armillaria nabsnona]
MLVRFAASSAFLEHHPHITTHHLRTWNPISQIAGRRGLRRSGHPKMSLEPATRMSLACISGTTTLRALLSAAEVFPVLRLVTISGEDTLGTQEALLLISQIPTVDRLRISLDGLNTEWLRSTFPRWRGMGVKRAESLLRGIADFRSVRRVLSKFPPLCP